MGMAQRDDYLRQLLTAAGARVDTGGPVELVTTALRQWVPVTDLTGGQRERLLELQLILMLEGDRGIGHLFYWRDGVGAEWTPAVGLAGVGYYRLPFDPATGLVTADGLADRVLDAVLEERPTLRCALESDAPAALAGPCRTPMTRVDAERRAALPEGDLCAWAAGTSGKDATRWRHVASFVARRRIRATEWK